MSSRLTLEELRRAEAIYAETAADWAWEHETVYRTHLEGIVEKVKAGSPAGLSNHLKLDKLYRQYADLGAKMLPAFTIALNELEEAQRLLKAARTALLEVEWRGSEVRHDDDGQLKEYWCCPICGQHKGQWEHSVDCLLGDTLVELCVSRKQGPELGVDTEARDG